MTLLQSSCQLLLDQLPGDSAALYILHNGSCCLLLLQQETPAWPQGNVHGPCSQQRLSQIHFHLVPWALGQEPRQPASQPALQASQPASQGGGTVPQPQPFSWATTEGCTLAASWLMSWQAFTPLFISLLGGAGEASGGGWAGGGIFWWEKDGRQEKKTKTWLCSRAIFSGAVMCSISLRLYIGDKRAEECSGGGRMERRGRGEDKGEGPH